MASLAAGGAAATGTGAFGVLARDRTASGVVVQDNNAYLQLKPNTVAGHNLSKINTDGELEVTLNKLNGESVTELDDVFKIRNNGTGPVDIRIINLDFPSQVNILSIPVTSGDAPNGNELKNNFGANLGVGEEIGVGVVVEVTDKGTGSANGEFDVDAA